MLGLPCGRLTPGADADLIQFELTEQNSIRILATYRAGQCVWPT
jgi:alpha-D-ribose 1-methylphosphonate 5-triphosphate diphosphatase PhnM